MAVVVAVGGAALVPTAARADSVVTTLTGVAAPTTAFGTALSPDGSRLFVTGGEIVSAIDTTTRTVTTTGVPGAAFHGVAVSTDGSRVYVTDGNTDQVRVLDARTLAPLSTITVGDNPMDLTVRPGTSELWVGNFSGGSAAPLSIIDMNTDTTIATVAALQGPRAIVFTSDGSRAYVSHGTPSAVNVEVMDAASRAVTSTIPFASTSTRPEGLALSANGSTLFGAIQGSNTLAFVDTATGAVAASVPVGASPTAVAVTAEGSRAYVLNATANTLSIVHTAVRTTTATVGLSGPPRSIAISPDDRWAYVATAANSLEIVALDVPPAITTLTVPSGTVGTPYTASIVATGSPTPSLSLSSGTLAPGMVLNAATGVVSGTPRAAGDYVFTVIAHSMVSGVSVNRHQDYTLHVAATAPGEPLRLAAAVSGSSIALAWAAPVDDGGSPVTGYRIERAEGAGPFSVLVADTGTTGTAFTDGGVTAGQPYRYRVTALNAAGSGTTSNIASATVPVPPVDPTPSATPTPQPSTTGADAGGDLAVTGGPDVTPFVAVAGLLIALGAALALHARRIRTRRAD